MLHTLCAIIFKLVASYIILLFLILCKIYVIYFLLNVMNPTFFLLIGFDFESYVIELICIEGHIYFT